MFTICYVKIVLQKGHSDTNFSQSAHRLHSTQTLHRPECMIIFSKHIWHSKSFKTIRSTPPAVVKLFTSAPECCSTDCNACIEIWSRAPDCTAYFIFLFNFFFRVEVKPVPSMWTSFHFGLAWRDSSSRRTYAFKPDTSFFSREHVVHPEFIAEKISGILAKRSLNSLLHICKCCVHSFLSPIVLLPTARREHATPFSCFAWQVITTDIIDAYKRRFKRASAD